MGRQQAQEVVRSIGDGVAPRGDDTPLDLSRSGPRARRGLEVFNLTVLTAFGLEELKLMTRQEPVLPKDWGLNLFRPGHSLRGAPLEASDSFVLVPLALEPTGGKLGPRSQGAAEKNCRDALPGEPRL